MLAEQGKLNIKDNIEKYFPENASNWKDITIQRLEKGESNPTGESLKRLANTLNVSPDKLIDWSIKEDKKYLIYLNLSALTFLFFPLLGILIPFILWTSKKVKIKDIYKLGKDLINLK